MLHPQKKMRLHAKKTCNLKDDDPFQRVGFFFRFHGSFQGMNMFKVELVGDQ